MSCILITGASSEIGIELMKQIVDQYDRIWAHYRTMNEQLDFISSKYSFKIKTIKSDFIHETDVLEMIEVIKKTGDIPDSIVHIPAEKYFLNTFLKTDVDKVDRNYLISYRSIWLILHNFLPEMVKEKRGKVILMLSSCIRDTPPKYTSAYTSIKYALTGLLKVLSEEYSEKGICFKGIAPHMVETKFLSEIPNLIIKKNAFESPKGCNLTAEEVAACIASILKKDDTIDEIIDL